MSPLSGRSIVGFDCIYSKKFLLHMYLPRPVAVAHQSPIGYNDHRLSNFYSDSFCVSKRIFSY